MVEWRWMVGVCACACEREKEERYQMCSYVCVVILCKVCSQWLYRVQATQWSKTCSDAEKNRNRLCGNVM